ncbi:DUF4435 domain-containing protein [Alistipes sp. OttesenSCG-928-B03]|nr:DUF4435 domain-containing protein [Alistipes sp. OttesenSCG-928-B03]
MGRRTKQQQYAERARNREQTPRGSDMPAQFNGTKKEGNPGWDRFKQAQYDKLPELLPRDPAKRLIRVFVEGYEDVSFWRGIFDDYESDKYTFEINVPPRADLAKGKKVILSMLPDSNDHLLLCVDSDFDYLFGNSNEQSHLVNHSKYLFHTYAYATENFLCYPPSLHNVCVKATKNDARIFDFEHFITQYSRTIYPLFLWYAYSAFLKTENVFTLLEFKGAVKLNYLEVENNGRATIAWLEKQVDKWLRILDDRYQDRELNKQLKEFEKMLAARGVTPETTYMYMQGHTLMDNVVIVMLNAVCDQLRLMSNIRITTSTKTGTALKNEMSNYNNSLRNVRDVLLDNESYKDCHLYKRLQRDIENYLSTLE